jgi:hypothetical protein
VTVIGAAAGLSHRGACPTRPAIRSQICAMASRSARSFSVETVCAVSRLLSLSFPLSVSVLAFGESTQQSVRADFREARAASLLLDDAERK